MNTPLQRTAAIFCLSLLTAVPFAFAAKPDPTAPTTLRRPVIRKTRTMVVPNVSGMAYVFAEGILEDAGFSWHVAGGNGFAANHVVAQSPAPGTRVMNTGAPLITLKVKSTRAFPERGTPENKSPYHGTAVRLAS
jgi:beta-lactam-binding protein with PASTA domain